jgi:outer membrane receptor protein involved in Fe transport
MRIALHSILQPSPTCTTRRAPFRVRHLLRLALLPATVAAACTAQAQQAGPEAGALVPTVEVKRSYDARRDDTLGRIVVRDDDLVRYGDTSLLDVLKRLPGVTVSGNTGRGSEIHMQGLGGGYTQVLIDGQRPPEGMAVETLAPDAIERIELLRAASAEVSTQSIAGTINIVLRKLPKSRERTFKAGYGAGRGTRGPRAALHLADRRERTSYSLDVDALHDHFRGNVPSREDANDAAGRPVLVRATAGHEDGSLSTLNLVPRLGWTFEDGDTLGLESFVNLNRFKVDVRAPTTTLLGDAPPYPDTRIAMHNARDALRSELHWVHGFASGARLDARFGGSASRNDDASDRAAGGNPAVGPLTQTIASRGGDAGLQSTGKLTVPLWDGHALAAGWDGSADRRTDTRRERDAAGASSAVEDRRRYAGRIARLAAYAQDEWNVTPRWSMYAGARWEGVRIHTTGSDFGDARTRASVFSPVLQTLYKLAAPTSEARDAPPRDQLRLALSRTYKAPTMDQLLPHRTTSVNNSQVEPDTIGNPDLKPELALGVDAAWEHNWADGALLSLSGSMRRIDGTMRDLVGFDGARWISQPANTGQARTASLQLEADFPLPMLLPMLLPMSLSNAPPIAVRFNVARNWSRVDGVPGPDNRIDGQTPLSGNLGLDYARGALTLGGNLGLRSGATVRLAANQTARLNGRRDLDLYAAWKLDARRQLRIAAQNLLGQDTVNERGYLDTASGTLLRNRIVNVGAPSLRATIESRF